MTGYNLIPDGKGLDNSLVAGWNMGQRIAGQVEDIGAGGFVGSIVGNPMQGLDRFGEFLGFDGVADYVDCGQAGASLVDNFSLVSWVKANSGEGGRLITRRTSGATQYDMQLNPSNGKIELYDGSIIHRSTTGALDDGKRHMLAISFDGAQSKFFVDGSEDGTFAPSISVQSLLTLLGAWNNGSTVFKGDIYAAAIYNKAKELSWIQQEYKRALIHF